MIGRKEIVQLVHRRYRVDEELKTSKFIDLPLEKVSILILRWRFSMRSLKFRPSLMKEFSLLK